MTKATETGRVEPTAGEAIPRPEQTRARAGAREGEEIAIRSVRVPPGMRRTPLVLVEVERHGLRLTFAVAMLRGGEKVIHPPRGPDGTGDGVWLPARDRDRIGSAILAAVEANPQARAALRRVG